MALEKEDYEEPDCCECGSCHPAHIQAGTIPLRDVLSESDHLFHQEKMTELGDHLRRWRQKAQEQNDRSAELTILSELMGHYRMMTDEDRGMSAIRDGLRLLEELHVENSAGGGTILLNAATALKAFGHDEEALGLYIRAARIYGKELDPNDWRFAGLFNNMASCYMDRGEYQQAETHYRKALSILKECRNQLDSAVTWLNLAQLYFKMDPEHSQIDVCISRSRSCFEDDTVPRDGYYAHTCRKCASGFGFLGYFRDEKKLNSLADAIYAGN